MRSGLQAIGLTITQGDQDLASAIGDVLLANNTMDAAVRLTVSRCVGARGIVPPNPGTPTIVITGVAISQGMLTRLLHRPATPAPATELTPT